jgi:class 3 adenylate cyclase/tetratricopeptide (TPR) repeat protein
VAPETRKVVTVVFCDVVGSTALGEQLDPEALRRVLARWFTEARDTLEHHGGVVEKFIGDAVMAVFGIPRAHEDDALRALRAASDLQERIARLRAELQRDPGATLETRVGVNTGEVVTGTDERLVTGDAVNVAARLEQSARPGEILLGDATYELVRDAVEVEGRFVSLRGKADSVRVHRLLHVREDAAPIARRLDTPLVGRAEELASLDEAFRDAVSERACRVLTVLGPPGIGKSRLAAELTGRVAAEATVLSGRCLAYGESATYWPLVEILRGDADHAPRARIAELLEGEDDAELVAERLGAAAGLRGEPGPSASEEIFWAVRRLFEHLARRRPLVVVLEDVHWGAPTFLDLLEYLSGWIADAPVLLLCLARPELLDARPSWRGIGPTLELDPLTHEQSFALIERLGNGQVGRPARERIVERAEGNPLFVEQLLAIAGESGDHVPPTIQAVLAERLDRLPHAERATLERASVVGREFWRGAVAELSPPEERPGLASSLLALARKGFVRPERSAFPGEDGLRFHHALIRDAAYNGLAKSRRSELHERAGRWLAAKDRELEQDHDEIVGYHLEQAYRYRTAVGLVHPAAKDLAREAAERLAAAGRSAMGRADMRAAAGLFDRARELLDTDDLLGLELAPELASAVRIVGELDRANAVLADAIAAAEALGEQQLRARARIVQLSSTLSGPQADPQTLRREANDLRPIFEEAGDDQGLAMTWNLLAQVAWLEARAEETAAALDRGIWHSRRVGARAEELDQMDMLILTVFHGPTPFDEGMRRVEEIRRRGAGSLLVESGAERALARFHAMRGRFDEAREHVRRGVAILEDLGLDIVSASAGQVTGYVESLAGDHEAAERVLRSSYDRLGELGEQSFRSTIAATLAEVLFEQGELDEAERFTRLAEEAAAARDISSQVQLRAVRGRILARRGKLDEAEAVARDAVDLVRSSDFLNLKANAGLALADVLRQTGRREEAAARGTEALALLDAKGNRALADRMRKVFAKLAAERE